jgi:hypothetical protein
MTRYLLESLKGVGAVHADDVLLRTIAYEISLWSDQPPGGAAQGVAHIDGHIDITGIAEAVVLTGPGKLTLTTEDGRRMAFQLTDSGGGFVGLGWLP